MPQLLWISCLDLLQRKIWRSYIIFIWRWNIILLTETNKKVCPNFSFQQKDAENFGIYLVLPQFTGYNCRKVEMASSPTCTSSSRNSGSGPPLSSKAPEKIILYCYIGIFLLVNLGGSFFFRSCDSSSIPKFVTHSLRQ